MSARRATFMIWVIITLVLFFAFAFVIANTKTASKRIRAASVGIVAIESKIQQKEKKDLHNERRYSPSERWIMSQ